MNFLLFPPVAFLLYLGLVAILFAVGRFLAGNTERRERRSAYASGEAAPQEEAASGYRAFSQLALYFAVLHLGILLLATGTATWMSIIFLAFLALLVLVREAL